MKTNEELNALKSEVETINKKLAELTEDELAQVCGGFIPPLPRAVEKHTTAELTGVDVNAGLPDGQIIT